MFVYVCWKILLWDLNCERCLYLRKAQLSLQYEGLQCCNCKRRRCFSIWWTVVFQVTGIRGNGKNLAMSEHFVLEVDGKMMKCKDFNGLDKVKLWWHMNESEHVQNGRFEVFLVQPLPLLSPQSINRLEIKRAEKTCIGVPHKACNLVSLLSARLPGAPTPPPTALTTSIK